MGGRLRLCDYTTWGRSTLNRDAQAQGRLDTSILGAAKWKDQPSTENRRAGKQELHAAKGLLGFALNRDHTRSRHFHSALLLKVAGDLIGHRPHNGLARRRAGQARHQALPQRSKALCFCD